MGMTRKGDGMTYRILSCVLAWAESCDSQLAESDNTLLNAEYRLALLRLIDAIKTVKRFN